MVQITLTLPDSPHERPRDIAQRDSISLNQLITLAIAEKISALETVDYLEERAARGSREKFERVLSKVRSIEPAEENRL